MYIYFKSINAVLTCEEYPQPLPVDYMKEHKLEYICNSWEKNMNDDGTFTLSYKYKKHVCNCDNLLYMDFDDYHLYECYTCRRFNSKECIEGEQLYLKNSGTMDIVWATPTLQPYCRLCLVEGHPNIYKWYNGDDEDKDDTIFALHIKNDMLSDENSVDELATNKNIEYYHILFVDEITTKKE